MKSMLYEYANSVPMLDQHFFIEWSAIQFQYLLVHYTTTTQFKITRTTTIVATERLIQEFLNLGSERPVLSIK